VKDALRGCSPKMIRRRRGRTQVGVEFGHGVAKRKREKKWLTQENGGGARA